MLKMENQDANFCLSGKPKPFSSKRDSTLTTPDKRPKETIFSKFSKSNNGSKCKTDTKTKERPKTAAVKNCGPSSFPIRVTLSRPSSANVHQHSQQKPGPLRGLRKIMGFENLAIPSKYFDSPLTAIRTNFSTHRTFSGRKFHSFQNYAASIF